MKALKKLALAAGFGQPYFDHWWRYRCPFDPLPAQQAATGFYFVHIPKTAGTSMLSALGADPLPYTHCPAHIIHAKHPEAAKSLFFFTVVRDPFDRFASSFEYITKRSDWPAQRAFADDVIGDMSFAAFCAKIARERVFRNLIMGYEFFFPQSYFTHHKGRSLIQDHLRFEHLAEEYEVKIQGRFAQTSALPSLRDHGGGNYKAMYEDESADLVRRLYAQDFELFGYAP